MCHRRKYIHISHCSSVLFSDAWDVCFSWLVKDFSVRVLSGRPDYICSPKKICEFIPDPDFCPSRIPDPKTATKERGEKKFVVIPFFVATDFTKLKIILCELLEKKKFRRIIELFMQKIVIKLSKIWLWDPRSGIKNLSRIQGSKRHQIPDPQHCDIGIGFKCESTRITLILFYSI
jgi:hypothetical protein